MKKIIKHQILFLTLLVEGVFCAIYLLWSHFAGQSLSPLRPSLYELLYGSLLALPLLVINLIIFDILAPRIRFFRTCTEFKNKIVKPIAETLDPLSALIISIAAGLGEECLFRGLIQVKLGLIIASMLFAFMHFGSAVTKYKLVFTLYLAFGFYFGIVFIQTKSLWTVISMHATYDFFALIFLRYFDDKSNY